MAFFGKNFKHKATLCLVALVGILVDCWLFFNMPVETFPYLEYLENGMIRFEFPKFILSFEIFIKMLMIYIFRKYSKCHR